MTDKYGFPCPAITPYQDELLTILVEECAEVQKAATKIMRFGAGDSDPHTPRVINSTKLSEEIGDLMTLIELCFDAGLANSGEATRAMVAKRNKLPLMMRFAKDS